MKRLTKIRALTTPAVALTAASVAQKAGSAKPVPPTTTGKTGAEAAGTLKMPPYKKVRLKNGATLLLMERHSVPLIGFQVLIRAGSAGDPERKEGTAFMTASLLRKGTKTRNAEQFASELDFIGGTVKSFPRPDGTPVFSQFF